MIPRLRHGVVEDTTLSTYIGADGIWSRISGLGPNPIPETVYINAATVDSILLSRFGSRVMREYFKDVSKDSVATQILMKNHAKWSDLVAVNTDAFRDAIGGTTTVKTEKGKDVQNTTAKYEGRDSTVAYDSDALVDESGTTNNQNGSVETVKDDVTTTQVNDVTTALSNLTARASYSIIDVITADIADYLTLKTY